MSDLKISRRSFVGGVSIFAAAMAGTALSGCSSDGGSTSTGAGADGGTLVLSLPSSPKYLDPIKYTGAYEAQIIWCVCDTLVDYNIDLTEIVPQLATEWKVSDDRLT